MEYYEGINQGDFYLCDRCQVAKLNDYEYENNVRGENRYCDECRNYIILKRFKCLKCNSQGTLRSERLLPKVCCGEEVTWFT
jgi:hypothetical protein